MANKLINPKLQKFPRFEASFGFGMSSFCTKFIKRCLERGNTPILSYDLGLIGIDYNERAEETCLDFKKEFNTEIQFDLLVGGVAFYYKN